MVGYANKTSCESTSSKSLRLMSLALDGRWDAHDVVIKIDIFGLNNGFPNILEVNPQDSTVARLKAILILSTVINKAFTKRDEAETA